MSLFIFLALLNIGNSFAGKLEAETSQMIHAENQRKSKHLNVFIIAHADDWQLFMGENAYKLLRNDKNIFIYLTAGDAGHDEPYWLAREAAAIASIHHALGSKDSSSENKFEQVKVGKMVRSILRVKSEENMSYYLRLPDGFHQGQGSKNYQNESIFKLWHEEVLQVNTVDKTQNYSKKELLETIHAIISSNMNKNERLTIHGLDTGANLIKTHSDHYVASQVAHHVAKKFENCSGVIYSDYIISERPINLDPLQSHIKSELFRAYDDYMKREVCETRWDDHRYQSWLYRSYSRQRSCSDLVDGL